MCSKTGNDDLGTGEGALNMTQKLSLQIALMTLIASALSIVLLVVGGGLAGSAAVDPGQVIPLAMACAIAFIIMLSNPFERIGH
jgi:hypothetical protein